MKIYKGEVSVNLTTEDFLELLEVDAVDEIINMVLDLEATGSIKGDYDGDMVYLGSIDLDDFSEETLEAFLAGYESDDYDYDLDNWEFPYDSEENSNFIDFYSLSEEDIVDNLMLSNEDLKLRRIVNRFSHMNDAF